MCDAYEDTKLRIIYKLVLRQRKVLLESLNSDNKENIYGLTISRGEGRILFCRAKKYVD